MRVKINRLYRGVASIRDHQIAEAKQKHEDLIINCNGEKMTVSYADLDKGTTNNFLFISRIDGKQYKLIDFVWNPDSKQGKLL